MQVPGLSGGPAGRHGVRHDAGQGRGGRIRRTGCRAVPHRPGHGAARPQRAALTNSGEEWPNSRITVNLLPAALPKHGSVFDLAIATVVLAGAGMLPLAPLLGVVLLGELGLDGSVRPVRGVLPGVLAAARAGITRVVVPVANAREAALVPGVLVRATDSLHRLIDFVR